MRMATAYKKGYDDVIIADVKDKAAEAEKKKKEKVETKAGQAGEAAVTAPPKGVTPGKQKDISPKGASGTKSVNITISIDKLIEKFNISTVNMQEGAAKIQELVAQTLLGAVRDSQIKAGI